MRPPSRVLFALPRQPATRAITVPQSRKVTQRCTFAILPLQQKLTRLDATSSETTVGRAYQNRQYSNYATPNFFDLKALDKRQVEVPLSDFKGKVVLVVNVASNCGFTPQYKGLEKLYQTYKDKGLVILGFPCNQFGGQEPGSSEDIQSFCQVNYGVTFPLMAKVEVNGDKEDPVFSFLKSQKSGILGLSRVKWNFEKFLVNKDGTVYDRYASTTSPETIAADIEKLLGVRGN